MAAGSPLPTRRRSDERPTSLPLVELLSRRAVRLVTLVGPGGIGKSRLAIEVAQQMAATSDQDVSFVLLEHVTDPARVVPAIAGELGVRDSGGGDLGADLGRAAGDRRMLIVLDNFEQVLDAAPSITRLFTEMPEATFLVTSRARLRLRGEQVYDVQPLALPDPSRALRVEAGLDFPAVRLFRDRARAANPLFDITAENIDTVARICVALEGVPLALELAAARIRVLSPTMLLERLDQRLALLVGSARDLPDRQRTIEATIEWSVGLLDVEPRDLLVRLGAFAGDFSLEAIEAVADAEWKTDTLSLLAELIDNSLIRSQDVGSIVLFGMLATVREFALARLEAGPHAEAVRRLHAAFYARLASETAPLLQGRTQLGALERLGAERDNLRAAGRHLLRDRGDRDPRPSGLGPVPVLVDPRVDARSARVDGCDSGHRYRGVRPHARDRPRLLVMGESLAGPQRRQRPIVRRERATVPGPGRSGERGTRALRARTGLSRRAAARSRPCRAIRALGARDRGGAGADRRIHGERDHRQGTLRTRRSDRSGACVRRGAPRRRGQATCSRARWR